MLQGNQRTHVSMRLGMRTMRHTRASPITWNLYFDWLVASDPQFDPRWGEVLSDRTKVSDRMAYSGTRIVAYIHNCSKTKWTLFYRNSLGNTFIDSWCGRLSFAFYFLSGFTGAPASYRRLQNNTKASILLWCKSIGCGYRRVMEELLNAEGGRHWILGRDFLQTSSTCCTSQLYPLCR